MGVIGAILGNPAATSSLGKAAGDVAEVFVPNATKKMLAAHDAYMGTLDEFGEEFRAVRPGFFDRFVNGLNRLPRPFLAFGTLGLFVYAMVDPAGFAERMQGLNYVPEPLWWLLAAIVGFYFGAREAHYLRGRVPAVPARVRRADRPTGDEGADDAPDPDRNAALDDWRGSGGAG